MRLSEFQRAVTAEFGDLRGRTLLHDLVLPEFGNRTPSAALDVGADPGEVWLALCRAEDVPRGRWHGAGLGDPKD